MHYGDEELLDELIYHKYIPKLESKIKPESKNREIKIKKVNRKEDFNIILTSKKLNR